MPRHNPRSDSRPTALLNSPCYLPDTKHELVDFTSYLYVSYLYVILCYVPQYYYSPLKFYLPIPTPTFFSSCYKNCKIFSNGLQGSSVCRQANLNQNELQAMPAAPWSITVLFRFSYQIQLKNQLLKFSLFSKTRLVSL